MADSQEQKPKRVSGKRQKKRKFTGNIHTREKEKLNESASGKKIKLSTKSPKDSSDEEFSGYSIVDLALLFSHLEKHVCCKTCGSNITLKEDNVCGLSSRISIECKNCIQVHTVRNSKMIGVKQNIPEINRRFLYAFRANGMGHAAMKLFCGIMDFPQPVYVKSYNAAIKKLLASSESVAKSSMKCAAEEEVQLSGSTEIIVSGDGTWKTRGHSSRVGVCTIIGDNCGKVIDTEVLSTYCKACDTWKPKKGTDLYNKWKSEHENECLVNHIGSAAKMEVIGMVRIFERSETKYDAKYVGYIGDGDAKTFEAVKQSLPYGEETEISKIECVGHIQKRMGSRLRKLKQTGRRCADGKSVGGKGRLTDKLIDQLTVYYGNAIREHKDSLREMRKAVWAIYFHTRSTDAEPLHSFCPTGPNTWCKYNKSVCEGTVDLFKHKKTIPVEVMDVIKPTFNDLSHPKLLKRCLGGKTQNNNESLNSLIWKMCPKTQNSGRRIAQIATNEAVILFNEGNVGRLKVMKELGLSISVCAKQFFADLDKQRIATAELRLLQSTKEMRKAKRMGQNAENQKFVLQEGTLYEAGGF